MRSLTYRARHCSLALAMPQRLVCRKMSLWISWSSNCTTLCMTSKSCSLVNPDHTMSTALCSRPLASARRQVVQGWVSCGTASSSQLRRRTLLTIGRPVTFAVQLVSNTILSLQNMHFIASSSGVGPTTGYSTSGKVQGQKNPC